MKSIVEIHPALPVANKHTAAKAAIVCADGFTMSVQASQFHYCTPRKNEGPHSKFEIGFPSQKEEALMQYAEQPNKPTGTVYGWVPAQVIDEIIAKHGGLKEE